MGIKGILGKELKIPVLGGISLKMILMFILMFFISGVALFGAVRIPYVGGYIATGLSKVKGWFLSNQVS